MPKYIILLAFFTILTFDAFSQKKDFKKVNYRKIEKAVKDKTSFLYYPLLFDKYKKADSLSLEEKRHLYYGYTFQSNYKPYVVSHFNDSIAAVFKRKMLFTEDYRDLERFSDSILKTDAFNVRAMTYKLFALNNLEKEAAYRKTVLKAKNVIEAILSSGDGLTPKTPFYVINPAHEYDIISVLDLEFGGTQSLQGNLDVLQVAVNERAIKQIYFDVSASLNAMTKMLK